MQTQQFVLNDNIDINDVWKIATSQNDIKVILSEESLKKVKIANAFVRNVVASNQVVYGINTGFGALANKQISSDNLEQLQLNLVRSHCTGIGNPFSEKYVRAILLLRAFCLAQGNSGVNPEAINLMLDFLNNKIHPIIPEKGSVGASGDLAPLAHMSLSLIGEGDVLFENKVVNSSWAIHQIGKQPLKLGPKDGLALINGTSVISALGSLCLYEAKNLFKLADIISLITLEGVRGTISAFHPLITSLKPHLGQVFVVENLAKILPTSEIMNSHKNCEKVQDPYSLRCIPQVHGAARQTLTHAWDVLMTEINSVTDNPLIFPDSNQILSGGNFHGQAPAFALDYLAMGVSEIGSISERRIEKMMNPTFSDLPAFLTKNPGLNSGLMIAHVTSAALASENKGLCFPASVDSIPTSTDKEDHVSMGVTSARKLATIVENTKNILAIELLCAFQAISFQRPKKSSPAIESVLEILSKHIPPIESDRPFYKDIQKIVSLIDNEELVRSVEAITGVLR